MRLARVLAVVGLVAVSGRAAADEILVSAASSLTDVMKRVGREFERRHPGATVRFNLASSGVLQRQIENGAPADVFVAAGSKEMDALNRGSYVLGDTLRVVTGNRLALVVPINSPVRGWDDLSRPAVRRLSLSNPDSVPSGRFARATLVRRKLWDAVRSKSVFGLNVRQTLAYVTRGEVDAGIVFVSDAHGERGRLRIAQLAIPSIDHEPIVYPAAVVSATRQQALARQFVAFLRTPTVQSIFRDAGFETPPANGKK